MTPSLCAATIPQEFRTGKTSAVAEVVRSSFRCVRKDRLVGFKGGCSVEHNAGLSGIPPQPTPSNSVLIFDKGEMEYLTEPIVTDGIGATDPDKLGNPAGRHVLRKLGLYVHIKNVD